MASIEKASVRVHGRQRPAGRVRLRRAGSERRSGPVAGGTRIDLADLLARQLGGELRFTVSDAGTRIDLHLSSNERPPPNGMLVEAGLLTPMQIVCLLDWRGIVIAFVWKQTPFVALLVSGAMAGLDRSMFEAARNLGAGALRTFWTISLPLAAPGLMRATPRCDRARRR